MKKLLCIFMAVLMTFSSAFVIGASAVDGYAAKNPITDSFSSYEEFKAENTGKTIYGYTPEFLYESMTYVDWEQLDIRYEMNGMPVKFMRGDLSLAIADMNSYLKRVMSNFFSGDKLYTEEYAVKLTNFFGKLVNPSFVPVTSVFDDAATPNDYDFYKTIGEKSGLADIIQTNWCNAGVDFKGFLTAFGVDLTKIVDRDFNYGKPIAKALIQGIVSSLLAYGPIEFAIRTLKTFSGSYSANLYDATTSLFSQKISQGKPVRDANGKIIGRTEYSVDEKKSIEGLLTYVFDGVIDYEFFKFPGARIVDASTNPDNSDIHLFLMMYFAINYRYNNNAAVVNGLLSKIKGFVFENGRYDEADYDYEEITTVISYISKMIDIILKGDITLDSVTMLDNLTQENLDSVPGDIFTQFKNWLGKIIRKITDYFDYVYKLFTGEIKYGESMLDR